MKIIQKFNRFELLRHLGAFDPGGQIGLQKDVLYPIHKGEDDFDAFVLRNLSNEVKV